MNWGWGFKPPSPPPPIPTLVDIWPTLPVPWPFPLVAPPQLQIPGAAHANVMCYNTLTRISPSVMDQLVAITQ